MGITGCTGEGFELGGLAWIGNNMNGYGICNKDGYNTGISRFYGRYWQTFAHELGHNFGGFHSFEEGQGKTGGLMDYGDTKLNGVYQFNTKHRKAEMCALVDSRVSQCGDNFQLAGPPPAPTPAPPATCDDCRGAMSGLCLWTDGKCYHMSHNVCSGQVGAQYCDGAHTTIAPATTTTSATTVVTTSTASTGATTVTTTVTIMTTTMPTTTTTAAGSSTQIPACGACTEWSPCLWTDGKCYPMSKEMCSGTGIHYCDSSAPTPSPSTTVVSATTTATTTSSMTITTTKTTTTTTTATRRPTPAPTVVPPPPTLSPTAAPTPAPTPPTLKPTKAPTAPPTVSPTAAPTAQQSQSYARTQWWPGCACGVVTWSTDYASKQSCEAALC